MLIIQKLSLAFIAFLLLFFLCLLLLFPQEGFQAAVRGVTIWWDILFPALFPFFVISEVMLGFGIVHFFGKLLDPFMRPLFRVPGIGGFVMAMGFAAGYPVGAKLTAQLWEQGLINRDEGERLVAFTSTSDPIFLIGAVSVGFFHNASLAAILALSHYGAGILLGFMMRFHGDTRSKTQTINQKEQAKPILSDAFQAMHAARLLDGRPLGELLKTATISSLRLVFIIGGLVVFFSTIIEMLSSAHILQQFYSFVGSILTWIHIPSELSTSVVNGFFEVTLGAKAAGSASAAIPLIHKVAIAAFVISWSGFSVHAQIISLLNKTDLRYKPFFLAKLVHGVISLIIVYLIWVPMKHAPAFAPLPISGTTQQLAMTSFATSAIAFSFILLLTLLLSFFTIMYKKRNHSP